jgi:hypothetical protein
MTKGASHRISMTPGSTGGFAGDGENAALVSPGRAPIENASDPGLSGALDCPEGARLIPLTRGLFAIVDESDFAELSQWRWYACPSGRKGGRQKFYAARGVRCGARVRHFKMHRQITGAANGVAVDHRNGNSLDCRRHNLRLSTQTQNNRNKRGWSALPKGVKRDGNRFSARITYERRQYYLGSFLTIEDASAAYDRAATRFFGEFARPNSLDEQDASRALHANEHGGEERACPYPREVVA